MLEESISIASATNVKVHKSVAECGFYNVMMRERKERENERENEKENERGVCAREHARMCVLHWCEGCRVVWRGWKVLPSVVHVILTTRDSSFQLSAFIHFHIHIHVILVAG